MNLTTQTRAPVPVLQNVQALIRRAGLMRAMADTLFVEAERIERFRSACAASNNPDGAAIWQRIANSYRTEAEACVFEADKLTGARP
ncbi:hypothetical protein FOH24_07170 [Acetobacter tropicalis]|uniref:Uncharacterized protein n=1 Tax=Acetobacter tropicalis TaxID=104102 RepID=A0A094YIG3_9PROT|nr:hypothetical protein [Acetobacter tropicalis]KAA8387068.1 hypothetical protein FOH22_10515 [Acetobacter tropicalis]KAA8391413.1 hypothetical protein FOH24_07170 [Acetobacter tropicalis]KGB21137.1 hypothetical protein AtDm6_3132 [Acetobacter tropicalis]MBC9008762.1 hypothetical protein [Acetobacter tropicalis]MDO8171935.1 hypothetical protein [Acetobacter tropicalis]